MQKKSNQLRRRLNGLTVRLQSSLEQSAGQLTNEIKVLIHEIQKLVKMLSSSFSRRRLRRMLGAVALLVGLMPASAFSQNQFALPVANPFGLQGPDNDLFFSSFVDIDNDGDLDLFIGEVVDFLPIPSDGASISFLENIGDAQNPLYDEPVINPFDITAAEEFAFPGFADIDLDGDMDLFLGEYYGGLRYFENIGDAENPEFAAPMQNPFGLSEDMEKVYIPKFIDIDADGDLDMTGFHIDYSSYTIELNIFINVSDAQNGTNFIEGDPATYNLQQAASENGSIPEFADMDGDGDLDMITGEYYGGILYFENTAEAGEVAFFAEPVENAFGYDAGTVEFDVISPSLVDIDGDGDIDLLGTGDYSNPGNIYFFENTLISSTESLVEFEGKFNAYPNPVSGNIIDLEIDQKMDRVELISTLGKTFRLSLEGNRAALPENLPPGHYVLKVDLENGQVAYESIIKN